MAGAPQISPALILGSLSFRETSRIVRLATREHGVVSAIAKGAMRPKSRFGASLQFLSFGQAHLVFSRSSDLHTLAAFDVAVLHSGLAHHLGRFGGAAALAEVAARFVPAMSNPSLFDGLLSSVARLESAPPANVDAVALHALWRLIGDLGVAPTLSECARDGAPLGTDGGSLSIRDGGFLCSRCGKTGATSRMTQEDRLALVVLVDGSTPLPELHGKYAAAHRRLLTRWVQYHLAEGAMPALEAWERGEVTPT